VKPFVIGKTRAYFRAGALEFLEASRLKGMEAQATRIQSAVRMYLAKKKADSIKRRAILERYQLLNDQAVSIQSAWRCAASRRRLRELRKEARNRAKKAKKREATQRRRYQDPMCSSGTYGSETTRETIRSIHQGSSEGTQETKETQETG